MNTTIPGSVKGQGHLPAMSPLGPCARSSPVLLRRNSLRQPSAARTIVVTDKGGLVVVAAIPDPKTGYSVELRPGTYRVDIGHEGIDRSP